MARKFVLFVFQEPASFSPPLDAAIWLGDFHNGIKDGL
jgi:hypothetical protein